LRENIPVAIDYWKRNDKTGDETQINWEAQELAQSELHQTQALVSYQTYCRDDVRGQ